MEQPSFFGEVLPVWSRCVDDDDEDDESVSTTDFVPLQWSKSAENELASRKCLRCDTVIIGVGIEACAFIDIYIVGAHKTEVLAASGEEIDTSDQKQNQNCVKRLVDNPGVLVVLCNTRMEDAHMFMWTEQLFSKVSCSGHSLIFNSQQTSRYSSENYETTSTAPFLRSIRSSSFNGTCAAPPLEQPNVSSGLAAELLTYLELKNASAVLYTSYTDVRYVDIETIKAFMGTLRHDPLKNYVQDHPSAERKLLQFVERHSDRSTLYI